MTELEIALVAGLKPCPFCGKQPTLTTTSGNDRAGAVKYLHCDNDLCSIKPHTQSYDVEEWTQGVGHYKVDKLDYLVKQWQDRREPKKAHV